MFAVKFLLCVVFTYYCSSYAQAQPKDLQNCETQLNRYRKFILQAILSFEDICEESATFVDSVFPPQIAFLSRYQAPQQKAEIWPFFKLLVAQFKDMELSNILHDAVIEKCQMKQLQQKRDGKRSSMVLGKKQRFHSWGGKRSSDGLTSANINNDLDQEHNDEVNFTF